MTIIYVNGSYVNEDLYKFPDPDLMIQSVTRKEDLNALGVTNTSALNGLVYFYIDKDWQNNTVLYVGETKNNLQSRHRASHSTKEWFANLRYPLIGIAQSPYHVWDTDTRRKIESLVLDRMNKLGFMPANTENSTWKNFSVNGYPQKEYLERIAQKIVEYQIYHLGLQNGKLISYVNTAPILVSHHLELDKTPSLDMTLINHDISSYPVAEGNLWDRPIEGRKLIAKSRGCIVRGYQTSEGLVVIYEALNIPLDPRPSASSSTRNLHQKLLAESNIDINGMKNWQGLIKPTTRTSYLSGFFGAETANIWKEDKA